METRVNEQTWRASEIHASGGEYAWSLWRLPWPEAGAGAHTIVSRAIDAGGNMQPAREERAKPNSARRKTTRSGHGGS